ncbi:autotransporter-associated beta strand repeat-containing protein [Sphingomonas sp. C3-2]|uniref:autotransporter-associated beta strand repeat-containing protein n=1 Tax=Sphingomonas sp. C3-2 TaxID=3062169 RepID=UPI00294B337E|nr:autotransporter-associated beta strand repeat-containing protein [Sphingomonas sp. C3-2]WOK36286.1 autotransporter-associated beta strand repeat-containing protein [Sphingomonas sp. C3-2]
MTHLRLRRNHAARTSATTRLHSTAFALVSPSVAAPAITRARAFRSGALLAMASALALTVAIQDAQADGGANARGDIPGGADNPTGPGGAGASDTYGGSGGGAGTTGGAGGPAFGLSGGGGAGGSHGFVSNALPSSPATGTDGQAGASASHFGGAGGAGGYGAVLTGSGALGTLSASVTGGNGGNGGNGSVFAGGSGGSGGVGLWINAADGVSLTLAGQVQGGTGGAVGAGDTFWGVPSAGAGGAGLVGENLSVTIGSTGSVAGGSGADAIRFTGGANTLSLDNGATLTGNIAVTGSLDLFQSTDFTLANAITGTGDLTKSGTGTLTLTGSNAYNGGTTISAGTLQIGNGGTTGSLGTGSVVNNASLIFNRSDALTFANAVSGTGALIKNGANTLILTGDNSYTGGTTISAGTLQIGNGGMSGSIAGNITNNATLAFNRGGTLVYGGVISGTGSLALNGTLVLAGANTYSGGTTINSGALQIGEGGATGSITGNVTNNGTLVFNSGAMSSFGGNISGTGALSKLHSGTLTLTGTNNYSGTTTITGGTLAVNDGALGSGAVSINTAATLAFNNAGTSAIANAISGAGALTKNGLGTLTLTGTNAYAGITTINAGALQIGNGGTTGTLGTGSIVNNAILTFNRSNNVTQSGAISGTGALIQNGTGTLILTGANAYTGGTTINAGTLQIGDGGTTGTLGTGNIVNNASLIFNRSNDITVTNAISGSGTLTKAGTGNLTLNAANSFTGGFNLQGGSLTLGNNTALGASLLTVSGASTLNANTGINLGNAITLNAGLTIDGTNNITLGSLIGGTGGLTFNGTGTLALNGASTFQGGVTVASGTLSIGNNAALGTTAGGTVVQNGAALEVRAAGDILEALTINGFGVGNAGALRNLTDGAAYRGAITLASDSSIIADQTMVLGTINGDGHNLTLGVAAGEAIYVNTGISNAAGLIKQGDGFVELRAGSASTLTGPLTINAGSVGLLGGSALNDDVAVTINAGQLEIGASETIGSLAGAGTVRIDTANQTLTVGGNNTSTTYSGVIREISGMAGGLTKAGTGTLTLTGANSYTGATTVNGGTLRVNGSLGSGAVTVNNGATLGGSGSIGGAVTVLSGGTLSAGNSPGTLTVASLTLGAGANSTFELNTPGVVGGTGVGGNDLVNVTGNLTLGGTLNAQAAAAGYYRLFNYGGALTGSFGTVDTSASAFTVDQARVETFIPGQVNLAVLGAGQTMQFWDGTDTTGNGAVNGGAGIWSGTGSNWTGQPGQAGINTRWGGSVGIFGGATGGTVTVQGAQSFDTLQFSTNGYQLTGDALRFDPATGSAATIQVDTGISATIASQLSDGTRGTALTKTGSGTLILTGANNYTGGTTISGGTLQIGDGGTTGTIAGDIVNNATLAFNRSTSIFYGGSLTGTGALVKSGSGSLTLTGSATHGGGTTVNDGILVIGNGGTNGSISGSIVNNADILINRAGMFTYDGAMTGTGALTLMGSGDTIFTGHSAIDGATVVRRGSLMITDGGTFTNYRANIDNFYSDSAAAFVSGAGSTWTNTFGLQIGRGDQGALTISNGGTVTVGDTASIGVSNGSNGSVIVNGAASSWHVDNLLYVGEAGTGALNISWGGTVNTASTILGNAATASGTVTVMGTDAAWTNSGVLTIGNLGAGTLNIGAAAGELATVAGTVSAASINLANGANSRINFNHLSSGHIFATPITGTGSVHQLDGWTILTGANSYTGGTVITGGALQIGDGGTTGTLTGNVTNNGTLAFHRAGAATFDGVLSGNGALRQYGSAHLTLTGNSAGFTGATTVQAGTLRVDGALGGSLALGTGASLEGAGHVGAVTVTGFGALIGRAGDTLGMDSLALSSDANVVALLGTPSASALFDVSGDLVLDGRLSINDAGGFGAGVYRLFDYGGTLTDNGLELDTAPAGIAADDLLIQTAVTGQVNLVSSAGTDLLFWDGSNAALHDNGAVNGGAGIWTATGRTWTGTDGVANGAMRPNPGFAVFQGAGGTVTLDASAGALGVTGMQFAASGYSLVGDTLALAGSGGRTVIRVGDGSATGAGITATIASALTGTSDLVKADRGTLTLTGINSYTGNTIVEGGTLIGNAAAIRGNIANAGTVIFDQAGNASFAGSIAGSGGVDGSMIKRGAGNLTLTGPSSLGWSIKEGSLITSTQAFTGDAMIAAGATLLFNQTAAGSYAGSLSGAGTLAIDGGHRVELTGNNAAFTGLFDVRSGKLVANGALGGTTRIGNGGFVGGNGTFGHMIVGAGGIASPGNSIGTLTINGDLTFEAGSAYTVEVDATGDASDRITVTGRAILNGGIVTHIGFDGNYRQNASYTILTADGGVTGQFAGVTSDYAFLDALLGYSANAVTLTLQRNDIDFATIGRNPNQRAVASAVQALDSGNPLFEAVVMLGADQARTAFDSLSGEIHASLQSVFVEESRFIRSAALDRMRLAGAATDSERGVAWWMQGIGHWGRLDGNANAHRIKHDAAGMLMGVDAIAAEKLQFGLFGGWQKGDAAVRTLGSEADIDSYHLGLYAGADTGRFSLRTGFAFGWHDADITRRISFAGFSETAETSRRASTAQGFAEIGYRLDLAGAAIEPFANIAHVALDAEAVRERGDAAALRIDHRAMNTSFTTLGARIGQSFKLGGMQADLRTAAGWRHAFGDRTPEARLAFINGDPFSIGGTAIAKDALSADIGLGLALSKRARLDVGYTGDVAKRVENHSARATFSLAF